MAQIDLTRVLSLPGQPNLSHVDWAAGVALGIAADNKWSAGSEQANDLVSEAHLTLVKRAASFDTARVPDGTDPDHFFRGYAHRSIAWACADEAKRITGGGTFNDPPEGVTVTVTPLPARLTSGEGEDADEFGEEPTPALDAAEELTALMRTAGLTMSEDAVIRALRGIGREQCEPGAVAAELGVTVGAVREMEAAALAKLKSAAGVEHDEGGEAEPLARAA